MYDLSNNKSKFESLAGKNRGGSFAEADPARRTMFARFMIGLRSIAALEQNFEVHELMQARVREQLEKTADLKQSLEQLAPPNIIPEDPVAGLDDIDVLRERVNGLAHSRVIHMPPEAAVGDFDSRLANGA